MAQQQAIPLCQAQPLVRHHKPAFSILVTIPMPSSNSKLKRLPVASILDHRLELQMEHQMINLVPSESDWIAVKMANIMMRVSGCNRILCVFRYCQSRHLTRLGTCTEPYQYHHPNAVHRRKARVELPRPTAAVGGSAFDGNRRNTTRSHPGTHSHEGKRCMLRLHRLRPVCLLVDNSSR